MIDYSNDFMKIYICLENYIQLLNEMEIPTLLERPPTSKEALKSYLATHLSLSTKYTRNEKLKFFLHYMEVATSHKILNKKDVYDILHIRIVGHTILDTIIMDYAIKNNDQESATEIMKFENEVHGKNKLSLLQCTRINLVNEDLKQWNVRQINKEVDNDCLGKIGINKKRKLWICLSIFVSTVFLSMLPYA